MSNNWYSSSSGESNNRRFSNQFSGYESIGQSFNSGNYGYEVARQSFGSCDYGGRFFGNREGLNSVNGGNSRANLLPNYQERHGDVGSDYSRVSEDYQQKYGDVSNEYIPNYSGNAREGFQQTYGVNYNGDIRQDLGQRYEVNARCNNRGNFGGGYLQRYEEDRYDVDNFRGEFKPKFGNNERGNLYQINYSSNNKETFNCNKLNTGKLKAMSNQGGVENYYKYQIKEEDVGMKKELAIKSEKNIDNSDDLIRLKEISSKERAQNYITNLVKEEVTFSKIEVKKEPIVKKEMDDRISRSEYFKNQIKDETSKKVEDKNTKTREKNEAKDEARYDSEASTVTKWNQYACLKPDCPETFQFWQAARRHMEEGCLPNVKRKRGKKVEESKIKSQKLNKLNPVMEERVQVKIEKYACLKSNCPETFQTWGDARRHMEKGCLPNVKTKRGKKVERSIKKAKKQNGNGMGKSLKKKVPVKNEEEFVEKSTVSNLNQYAGLKPDCPETFGYACLKPACPETFQFWGEARRHMAQGCLQTIKSKKCTPTIIYPTIGLPIVLSQKKAKKQRGMKPPMEEKAPLKMEKM